MAIHAAGTDVAGGRRIRDPAMIQPGPTGAVRTSRLGGKLVQYGIASVGPFGSAAVQFLLSLVLLRITDTAHFGTFSFLLIAAQLSWGIWSALFCAPLPVTLARGTSEARAALLRTLFSANLIGAVVIFLLFAALGLGVGLDWWAAALFAAFSAAAVLRWFARAYAYATGTPLRAAVSDIIYSMVLLPCVPLIAWLGDPSLKFTWAAMLLATCAGFVPFGSAYVAGQFSRIDPSSLVRYLDIWREHASWSLLGVVSTEATANAHVYIVTTLMGPSAFAPLAASALLIRPITVAMNALTEYERARMARQIGNADIAGAAASARFFRLVLIATWGGTAIATILLLAYKPGLVFPARYERTLLAIGAALWMAVAGIRLLRMPESCLLQAAGAFRPLAFASVWSSAISVVAVLVLLAAFGPLWSIIGILLGETAFALWIWLQTRRWFAGRRRDIPVGTPPAGTTDLQSSPVSDLS